MSDWQPIESAPKGPLRVSPVSEWFKGRQHGPVIIVGFAQAPKFSASVGWWEPRSKSWRLLDDDGPNDIQPTHWMPVLEPPEQANE